MGENGEDRKSEREEKKRRKKGRKERETPPLLTFPSPLEKEPDDKNLQAGHANHEAALDHAEVEDARLGALDRAEVAVLPRAEVLLVPADGRQLPVDFVDGFLERRGLFGRTALLAGELGADFVFDLVSGGG